MIQCLLLDYPNLPWMPMTSRTSYGNYKLQLLNCYTKKILNDTICYQNNSRACAGHYLVTLKLNPSRGTVLPAPHVKGNKCEFTRTRQIIRYRATEIIYNFGRFLAFWKHTHFSCLKMIEIVIMWV